MCRFAIETLLVAFEPICFYALIALFGSPITELNAVTRIIEIGNTGAAGCLHQFNSQIKYLPRAGKRREKRDQFIPFGIIAVNSFGGAI